MATVEFIDTTLRDGNQSLWAMGMRTEVMLPAIELMDAAGFESMEFWLPSVQLSKTARELGEDPWQWLDLGTARAVRTPLRLHGTTRTGFRPVPAVIARLLLKEITDHGIRLTRTSDPWNDFDLLAPEVEEVKTYGMSTVVNLIYSVSPKHTDEYYLQRAMEAAAIRPYRVCFKDVGGLLTPERARTLFPLILDALGDVPLEFHSHCCSGFAPICCLVAVDAGVRYIHTAIPPLADGSSNPSIFNVARNLEAMGHTPAIDLSPLHAVSKHFEAVAARDGLPVGRPVEYDHFQYLHQVPGGMISNFRHQLGLLGAEDRLEETLHECVRVRAEFGYPIMVTPLSQFVGTQAALNVISGQRYRVIPDGTIEYALGRWGRQAIVDMDPEIRQRILEEPRAAELIEAERDEPTLQEIRQRHPGTSDRDLILEAYVGDDLSGRLAVVDPAKARLLGANPLVDLVASLAADSGYRYVSLTVGDLELTMSSGGDHGDG